MSLPRRIWKSIARRLRHWRLLKVARAESLNSLGRVNGGNILVLCYGNIYRSPFVANKLASLLDNTKWEIRSAGFYHKSNRPCAEGFVQLANTFDVDLSQHRSRQVTEEEVEWADLIVIMDCKNRDLLHDLGDAGEHKVVWVAACLMRNRVDVEDPFGTPEKQIHLTAERLNQATEALADRLSQISS